MIARGEPFAIVWSLASHDVEDEPHEDEKRANQWVRRRRMEFAAVCRGYTYIVADPQFRVVLEAHLAKAARVMPFPKHVLEDRGSAMEAARTMVMADG